MTKKNVMPVVVLSSIALVVAAVLAVVNMICAPIIEKAENEAVAKSLREVLPWIELSEDPTVPDGAPETVNAVYKDANNKGYVVTLTTKGYAGDIDITVGIDENGKVVKALVTKESESHGKPGMDSYTDNFAGLDSDGVLNCELFSGATVTSTAIRGAIYDALVAVGAADKVEEGEGETLPRTDEELLNLAGELVSENSGFTSVSVEGADPSLKRVFKEKSGLGAAIYIVTYTQYNPKESEILLHIAPDGKIVSAKLLSASVGGGLIAPDQSFIDKFVGKDYESIDDVELISSVTYTSENIRKCIKSAVEFVVPPLPRTDGELLNLGSELVGGGTLTNITPETTEDFVKRIYSVDKGGYVVYIVTKTEYNPLESEIMLYLSGSLKIEKAKLLSASVGGGLAAPDQSFIDKFVGKDKNSASAVELVSSVTYTSANMKLGIVNAISDVEKVMVLPDTARIVGISVLAVCLVAAVIGRAVYVRRRRV